MSRQELKEKSIETKKAAIRYGKSLLLIGMVGAILYLGVPTPGEVVTIEQLGGLGVLAVLFVAQVEWIKA